MLHICMDASVNHIIHNHITLITLLGVHHAHHVSCQCTRCMLNWQPCSQDSPVFTSGITRTPLKLHACKLKIKNGKPREKMDGRRLHTFAESPAVSFIHSALNSSIPSAPSREAPPPSPHLLLTSAAKIFTAKQYLPPSIRLAPLTHVQTMQNS